MIRIPALLTAALIALAGCGGSTSDGPQTKDLSSLSAKAVLAKARAQVLSETDVAIASSGSGTDPAHQAVTFAYSGHDSYGTIGTDYGVLTLFNVAGVTYYKADDEFWKTSAGDQATSIIAKLAGRWIKPAADSSFNDFLKIAQQSALSTQILAPQGTVTKAGTKTVNGIRCIVLKDSDVGSLYVSAKNGRPIQLTSKANGVLTFSYDKVNLPDAPTAAEIVDESAIATAG